MRGRRVTSPACAVTADVMAVLMFNTGGFVLELTPDVIQLGSKRSGSPDPSYQRAVAAAVAVALDINKSAVRVVSGPPNPTHLAVLLDVNESAVGVVSGIIAHQRDVSIH